MQFNPETLLTDYGGRFGKQPGAASSAGLRFLLQQITDDAGFTVLRQVAYLFATIKHETGDTFGPIRERMARLGRSPEQDKLFRRQQEYKPYYGRGYVQLTWEANYAAAGSRLAGMTFARRDADPMTLQNDSLVQNPDLVLEPTISYAIASRGMREGWSTRKKLDQYIKEGTPPNYVGARAIINPGDRAELVGGYADKFELMLRASLVA